MSDDGGLVVFVPKVPCGLTPAYCASGEHHPAHDHGPTEGPHAGTPFWHCYGIHANGAATPDRVLEDCGWDGKERGAAG